MIEPPRLTRYPWAYMPTFGDNLKRLRERRGLTQEALALKLNLKRPTPISLAEGPRKHSVPKATTIKKLAAALEVQPFELLEGVETEYDKLRNDPIRHTPTGTSFASQRRNESAGAADAAEIVNKTRVLLREVTDAYEKLAGEVLDIGAKFAAIVGRLNRDPLGVKTGRSQKKSAHRRRRS